MVNELFTQLTAGGSQFITFLKSLMTSVISLFWTEGVGDTAGSFTSVGILMLVGVAIGVVYGVISYITRFIKLRG